MWWLVTAALCLGCMLLGFRAGKHLERAEQELDTLLRAHGYRAYPHDRYDPVDSMRRNGW